jgi:hypothetical protein
VIALPQHHHGRAVERDARRLARRRVDADHANGRPAPGFAVAAVLLHTDFLRSALTGFRCLAGRQRQKGEYRSGMQASGS